MTPDAPLEPTTSTSTKTAPSRRSSPPSAASASATPNAKSRSTATALPARKGTVSYLNDNKKSDGWKIALTEKDAFVQYDRVEFGKATLKSVKVRALSATGGTIEVRLDKTDGPVLAKIEIPKSEEWKEISANLATPPSGMHNLVVTLPEKNNVEIDWVSFE